MFSNIKYIFCEHSMSRIPLAGLGKRLSIEPQKLEILFIASSKSWSEGPARKVSFTVTRVPARYDGFENFRLMYRKNMLQLFELQDNDKIRDILIENGSLDCQSLAHLYGNHNRTGNQNKRKQCIKYQ
jgi:hypothetical protein